MPHAAHLLPIIQRLHRLIRAKVLAACEQSPADTLAQVAHENHDDTIYAIDRVSEAVLLEFFERELTEPVVLIAEGLPTGEMVLPAAAAAAEARWRIIIDPIDGTRGLMYQKRPGWILTGVAPNRGPATTLQDIVLAVQTEIPLVKQHLSDELWAIAGWGARASRVNRLTGESVPLRLTPSSAATIAHGFASVSRFFPGHRAELAAIDDELIAAALGPAQPGKAQCFEDQYICSGGQLYELLAGHDRFIADLRPLLSPDILCSHPYDLCTELIARELGVIVTNPRGQPLAAPLDVLTGVAWVGYANRQLQTHLQPHLHALLKKRGYLPD